jgi:hypothetical protein
MENVFAIQDGWVKNVTSKNAKKIVTTMENA